MIVRLLNIILFLLLLTIIYGLYKSLPAKNILSESDIIMKNNKKIKSDNYVLRRKIQQVVNDGPIIQQKNRYYHGYYAGNETFYRIKSWS